jgi:hypothetical protein
MKRFVFYLVLLFNFSISAQTLGITEILLDENGKQITKEEFTNKIGPPDFKYTYYRAKEANDATIYHKLILRKETGIIEEIDKFKIIAAIKEITGKEIHLNQTIIINFYFMNVGADPLGAVKYYSNERKFKRFIRNNKQYAQFHITEKGLVYENENVYEDKFGKIANMLFSLPFSLNYIIIKPDGSYYKYIGEYNEGAIPTVLEADWNIQTK